MQVSMSSGLCSEKEDAQGHTDPVPSSIEVLSVSLETIRQGKSTL